MATESGKTEPTAVVGNSAEAKTPEQIEAEIEATREELGETVAELADKADVKKHAKTKVAETKTRATTKKDELKEKAAAQKEAATAKVANATPDSAHDGAQRASQAVQQATARAAQ